MMKGKFNFDLLCFLFGNLSYCCSMLKRCCYIDNKYYYDRIV